MRMHIELEDELVKRIDGLTGPRGRTSFIRKAIDQELDFEERVKAFKEAAGSLPDYGSHLGGPPYEWIRRERRQDPRRVG